MRDCLVCFAHASRTSLRQAPARLCPQRCSASSSSLSIVLEPQRLYSTLTSASSMHLCELPAQSPAARAQPRRQGSLQVVPASSIFPEHVHGLPVAGVRSQGCVFVCVAPAQGLCFVCVFRPGKPPSSAPPRLRPRVRDSVSARACIQAGALLPSSNSGRAPPAAARHPVYRRLQTFLALADMLSDFLVLAAGDAPVSLRSKNFHLLVPC
jgi:hypothetical protein